jgi:hypothetical protein
MPTIVTPVPLSQAAVYRSKHSARNMIIGCQRCNVVAFSGEQSKDGATEVIARLQRQGWSDANNESR